MNQVVESTVITFPDKNLEQVIRTTINKPTGAILKGDVDKITSLESPVIMEAPVGETIANLSGIENLTKLTKLSLMFNQINNIEPLKGLTKLTHLELAHNQISNIESLRGLTKLTNLNLRNNQINNIQHLKGLTKLTWLQLSHNQIKNYTPVNSYYNNLHSKDFTLP